jgi:hypothetical protein
MSCFIHFDRNEVIHNLAKNSACVVDDFITPSTLKDLQDELPRLKFHPQPSTYGKHNVTQNFELAEEFDQQSYLFAVQMVFERMLNAAFTSSSPWPISEILHFNEARIQRYQPCKVGISPHRDGAKFINIIALLVLEGAGEFCICDDRDGTNTVAYKNKPGSLILMVGPGFLNENRQPFHYVRNVTTQRTTFAFRHHKE